MQHSDKRTRLWDSKIPSNITKCASLLYDGKLVAFPTETVYGLGANAMDKNAILNIFLTKKRPLTDPLIVHIHSIEMAKEFLDLKENEMSIFTQLVESFWPGPLTIVGRAQKNIPKELCANTGYVGVRFPQHKLTLDLLTQSKVAVAAPSANLFGHVSPTKAEHVFKDFTESDIDILDGGSTPFGIESTVIKLTSNDSKENLNSNLIIEVLRHGSVSFKMLNDFVTKFNDNSRIEKNIELIKKRKIVSEEIETESPGQFLKHYSPNLDSYILKKGNSDFKTSLESNSEVNLTKSILIDFGTAFKSMKDDFGIYLDLSPEGDLREAMKNYYSFLRGVEEKEDMTRIFIVDLNENKNLIKKNVEFIDSLQDKIFRSCEGHFAIVKNNENSKKVFLV